METSEENSPTKLSDEPENKISPWAHDSDLRYKFWHLLATYLSLVVATFGIIYVVRSLNNNTKSVRNSVQQNVVGLVTNLDRVFIDKPHLHPYFYQCKEIKEDPNDPLYQEVFAAAIQTLDVLDIATAQSTRFRDEWDTPEAWDNWIEDQLAHSPVLREVLHKHRSWYGKGIKDKLEKVEGNLKKMEQENKHPCGRV